jgi:transcriptional regulator with XRE-family HTH domain
MSSANFWGGLIRTLRSEKRITQRTLAVEAKVNRSTLRRIEAGQTAGDVEILERVLGYLGYELEALDRNEITEHRKTQSAIRAAKTKQLDLESVVAKKSFLFLSSRLTMQRA